MNQKFNKKFKIFHLNQKMNKMFRLANKQSINLSLKKKIVNKKVKMSNQIKLMLVKKLYLIRKPLKKRLIK